MYKAYINCNFTNLAYSCCSIYCQNFSSKAWVKKKNFEKNFVCVLVEEKTLYVLNNMLYSTNFALYVLKKFDNQLYV